jgi:hypothetical protein
MRNYFINHSHAAGIFLAAWRGVEADEGVPAYKQHADLMMQVSIYPEVNGAMAGDGADCWCTCSDCKLWSTAHCPCAGCTESPVPLTCPCRCKHCKGVHGGSKRKRGDSGPADDADDAADDEL